MIRRLGTGVGRETDRFRVCIPALATETQKHRKLRQELLRFEVTRRREEVFIFGGTALATPASNAAAVPPVFLCLCGKRTDAYSESICLTVRTTAFSATEIPRNSHLFPETHPFTQP
jgi:hypothetical protein